jgi:two-component system CheB/CheR fusion protein
VREPVIFAVHDLVTDPHYSRVDVVSIRNLLIYFDIELQRKVLPMLHYALNEGGLLFLGTSETIGEFADLFATVDAKWRIYRSMGKKKGIMANLHQPQGVSKDGTAIQMESHALSRPSDEPLLLLEALPPSVLVDRNYQVLYIHADTSKYLRMSEGKPSSSILHLSKPELGSVLATLLHEASKEQKEVASENLRVKYNGGTQPVKITVRPISTLEGTLIITFEDLPRSKRRKVSGEPVSEAEHQQLEEQMRRTQNTLGETIEELKTANEDSSELMARLIDDLIKLSRVTRNDINYDKVNFSDMAQQVVEELAKVDPTRKVKVIITQDVIAYGDRNLLRIVLDNLIGNAWKFSSKTNPKDYLLQS